MEIDSKLSSQQRSEAVKVLEQGIDVMSPELTMVDFADYLKAVYVSTGMKIPMALYSLAQYQGTLHGRVVGDVKDGESFLKMTEALMSANSKLAVIYNDLREAVYQVEKRANTEAQLTVDIDPGVVEVLSFLETGLTGRLNDHWIEKINSVAAGEEIDVVIQKSGQAVNLSVLASRVRKASTEKPYREPVQQQLAF